VIKLFKKVRNEESKLICEQVLEGKIEELAKKDVRAQDNFMMI
jgi:hypothetical protein